MPGEKRPPTMMIFSPARKSIKTGNGCFPNLMFLCFALTTVQYFLVPLSRWADLNLAVAFIGLYLAPGYLLYSLIFPRRGFLLEAIPVSFCFSLSFLLLPLSLLGYIFSTRVILVWGLYFFISFILFVLLSCRAARGGGDARTETYGKPLAQGLLIASILAAAAAGFVIGGFVSGDALVHIPLMRKYELPVMAFSNPWYRDCYGSEYGVATWHVAMALLSSAARVDIIDTYARIPFLLIPVYILSFLVFCRAFFRRNDVSYTCTYLFIFFFGVLSLGTFTGEIHPLWEWSFAQVQSFVARSALLTIALAFSFSYLYSRERRYLWLVLLLLVSTATVNLYYLLIYEFFMASMLLAALMFDRHDRRFLQDALRLAAVALIPFFFYVLPTIVTFIAPTKNPQVIGMTEVDEFKGIVGVFQGVYPYLNPNRILWADTPRKLGFLLVPFLLFFRKEKWAQFLFGVSVAILLITLNPFFLLYIRKADVTLTKVMRLSEFPIHILIVGFFITWLFGATRAQLARLSGRFYRPLAFLLGAVLLACISYPDWGCKFNRAEQWNETRVYDSCSEIRAIRDGGIISRSRPLVVLSDPNTSELWLFYFPHYTVYVWCSILGPFNIDPTPRFEDLKQMLSPGVDEKTTRRLLDFYGIDIIVINRDSYTSPRAEKLFGAPIAEVKRKFSTRPGIYAKIYEGSRITVFQYLPRSASPVTANE